MNVYASQYTSFPHELAYVANTNLILITSEFHGEGNYFGLVVWFKDQPFMVHFQQFGRDECIRDLCGIYMR